MGGRIGGFPQFFPPGILLFFILGSHYKITEPYEMPFWVRFEIWPFSGQNRVNWEGRGLPHSIFPLAILLFLLLRSPYKITEPYDVPFCVSFKICPFSSENRVNEDSRKKRSSNHRTLIFLESG